MQWAAHMVNEAKDRSKTLIKRVMHLSDANDSFAVITKGLETWTEISKDATHYNADVLQGLDVPKWRETKDLKHETILESVNLASLVNPGEPLPGGRTDIQTTVWYGRTLSKPKQGSKVRTNLMKGIQCAAAVFLLEAMVLVAASAEWSGSWTQRMYGTGSADVWEVFGNHNLVTEMAWKQGWRTLEPLNDANYQKDHHVQYINDTVESRQPRLIVIEAPEKIWTASRVMHMADSNAKREKR